MRVPVRKVTKEIRIGNRHIGNGMPILVQSMTNTKTTNVEATLVQINSLAKVGCELIRITVPSKEAVDCLHEIRAGSSLPIVADIHFNVALAIGAIEAGCDKVRINPGNLGGEQRFREVIAAARLNKCAIRIGVNSGSVDKLLLEKYGGPTAEAMVQSALQYIAVCEEEKFDQVVVSIKASSAIEAVVANRRFSELSDYPLHLGITEAGGVGYGSIKSAVGIGSLLLDGIGDTIRVSLTGDPINEIGVAFDILKASGARVISPEVVSCPTCGRIQYGMEKIAAEIEKRISGIQKPIRIAVMGCLVNGPGEAKEADIAIAGGNGEAVLYKKGVAIGKVPEGELVDAVVKAVMEF